MARSGKDREPQKGMKDLDPNYRFDSREPRPPGTATEILGRIGRKNRTTGLIPPGQEKGERQKEMEVRIAEREERNLQKIIFQSPAILLTDESTEEQLRDNQRRAYLTINNCTKKLSADSAYVPSSPIAAIHIIASNTVNVKDPVKRIPTIKVFIALRNGSREDDLKPINTIIEKYNARIEKKNTHGMRKLPLIGNVGCGTEAQHEDHVKCSSLYRASGEKFKRARYFYSLPKEITFTKLEKLGLLDPATASICRSFVRKVDHLEFLELGQSQQKIIFSRRMGTIAKDFRRNDVSDNENVVER